MIEIRNENLIRRYANETFKINKTINNLKFIHIGKCGGTSILYYFLTQGILIQFYHLEKPILDEDVKYFMWIRDPVDRFISCFNHLKGIVEYQIPVGIQPEDLNLENCPAPYKIQNKIKSGFCFSEEFDSAIKKFKSAEDLISSLLSENDQFSSAELIINSPFEHINKGISWYMHEGEFIEKNFHKFIMLGSMNNFSSDLNRLLNIFNLNDCVKTPHKRISRIKNKSNLSEKSTNFLKNEFLAKDYYCLNLLKEKILINSQKVSN